MKRFASLAARADVRQGLRFLAVGAAATGVQYAALIMLVEAAHVAKVPASIGAYLCGAVASYTLNRAITFAGTKTAFGAGAAKFLVVNLSGLVLNTAIFWGLTHLGAHYLLAQLAATGVGLVWNYLGARLFVFR